MTDEDIRAAEYVIGTLSNDERRAFEKDLARQTVLQRRVDAWREKLSPLDAAISPVSPPPDLWAAIEDRLEGRAVATADVVRLRTSRNWWRRGTLAFAAIAASLVIYIAARPFTASTQQSFIAVIDRGGKLPALIVRVDTGARTLSLQPVALEYPDNQSLELWYIAGSGTPKSLGVMKQGPSSLILPAVARADDIRGSTLAVSVEPRGGSKTGLPTGPVIYSGQLIPE